MCNVLLPGTPEPGVTDLILLWGIYSLMAYILLTLIRRYRVGSIPALLVVGAAYGWMLEGGIVATVYEELPFSLSFTALHCNDRADTAPDLLQRLSARPRGRNLLAWLAFPPVAAGEYALWAATDQPIPSNVVGYLITVPLGFGLFGWALWRTLCSSRRSLSGSQDR